MSESRAPHRKYTLRGYTSDTLYKWSGPVSGRMVVGGVVDAPSGAKRCCIFKVLLIE